MRPVLFLAAILAIGLLAVTNGCGGTGSPTNSPTDSAKGKPWPDQGQTRLYAMAPDRENQRLYDEKGKLLDRSKLVQLLSSEFKQGTSDVVEIGLLPENSPEPPDLSEPGRWGFNIGSYRVMIRWEGGYVGGCIRRNTWRHLNFQIRNRDTNTDVFNWHTTGWWENGPQAGVYNSASGWCATTRGTWTGIRDAIARMLMESARLSPWAAYAIAGVAAWIIIGAFAF